MRIKCLPTDFQVDEILSLEPTGGKYALYELRKTSITTFSAVDRVARAWRIPREELVFAGLKDKHACTTQGLSIFEGPRKNLSIDGLEVRYVGQTPRAIHPRDIVCNEFLVIVRDLSDADLARSVAAVREVNEFGLPNYFDKQRFGSLGESGEFVAKAWCQGDHERALFLAVADPNSHDSPSDREQKQILREHWGNFGEAVDLLPMGLSLQIAEQLAIGKPDYKRALTMLKHDLRSLLLSAYQSDIWNRLLSSVIRDVVPSSMLFEETIGPRRLAMFHTLDPKSQRELQDLMLPLPSARLHLPPGPLYDRLAEVLAEDGMTLRELRVKYPRDTFFSKGDRAAIVRADELEAIPEADERYPGKQKLLLSFSLRRASYATMLVKRITALEMPLASESDETQSGESPDDDFSSSESSDNPSE